MLKQALAHFIISTLFPFATIFNVNSGQSTSTIQSTVNTAGASSGNTVQFAAGTYNLTSHLIFPCSNGTVYTGPVNSAGVTFVNNQAVQQTSVSPAIINYEVALDSAFVVNGGSGASAGAGCTIQYFSGGPLQIFTGGIPNVSNANTSGVLIQNNTFSGNTSGPGPPYSNWNPAGTAIYLNTPYTSNTSVIHNWIGTNCADTTSGFQSGPACGAISAGGSSNLIDSNVIDGTEEGVGSAGGGTDGMSNVSVTHNIFRHVHRIALEITFGNSPGIVTNNHNDHNIVVDPLNPWAYTFGWSYACCYTAGSTGDTLSDNVLAANNASFSGHYGYGIELTGGTSPAANYNLIQGYWPNCCGIAIGDTKTPTTINNIIQGPNMTSTGYANCEYSGTYPNGCVGTFRGAVGTVTNTGQVTGATTIQQTTATPGISPSSGSFGSPPTVTLTDNQSSQQPATVFYTTNGSTPTTASTVYTGPFACASLPCTVKALSQWGTGAAMAYPFPAGYGWAPSSATSATYTAGTVTLTTTQPPYGWLVMPGSARTPIFYPGGGATTKLLNYSVTGGATLSCTSNCLPEVTVTMPSSGGTCSVSGSVGSYVLTSTVRPILTATSVDDPTKTLTVPFNVCDTTIGAVADVEPSYQQAYGGQKKTLQSYVIGYVDQSGTWSITTQPGGGDGTLTDTGNRDTQFSATVSGRYIMTYTSSHGPSATAIVYVAPTLFSSLGYTVTPNKTVPVPCVVDPALTGTDYEVGPGQAFPDFTTLNLRTWTAGSIVRVHPGTYTNSTLVQSTGTAAQPLIICGIADSSGNLPVIDGFNATENAADTGTSTDGLGGIKVFNSANHYGEGYELGSTGPDFLSITGLKITRFNLPYSYHPAGSASLVAYSDGPAGVWIGEGQHIHMEGLDLVDDDNGVLANNNTVGVGTQASGRHYAQFYQFMGGHISNFSNPGSFSTHALYMEGSKSLVEGTLFETPQYNLSDPTAPLYDNGDFIKMRGSESIIRYNMFRGILTAPAIVYPDMEDTVSFVDVASMLGQPGVANCSLSTQCSITSNNITLPHLAENMESLAKDYFYGNVVSNEGGNQVIALLWYGSYSATQECAQIGYWCTPGIDRGGQLYAWSNTFDQPSNWNNGNDSGVFLTANPFTSNFVAAAMPIQPTIFAGNNIWWNDTTATCSGPCFPFSLNVDATMIATFQTNMSASGALPFSGTITGGTTTGYGGYTNVFSYPLANPMQTHLSGLASGNFLTTINIPYNRTTFAPVAGSPLISAGSQITLTEIAKLPVRYQPLNSGFMGARTDSASAAPTIGAVQTGSLPTFTATLLPSPSTLTIPHSDIGQQVILFGTATFADGTSSFTTYRSQPFASSNTSAITFFGSGSSPAGNVLANGSGTITSGFGGLTPSVNFTVGATSVANPTFSPVAGTYAGTQNAAISTVTGGATICYTTNGTTPAATIAGTCDAGSTTYSSAVVVASSLTIKAMGTLSGNANSSVMPSGYVITALMPNFKSKGSRSFKGGHSIK